MAALYCRAPLVSDLLYPQPTGPGAFPPVAVAHPAKENTADALPNSAEVLWVIKIRNRLFDVMQIPAPVLRPIDQSPRHADGAGREMLHPATADNSACAANCDFLAHEPHKGLSTPTPAGKAGSIRCPAVTLHRALQPTDACSLESICRNFSVKRVTILPVCTINVKPGRRILTILAARIFTP